MLQSAKSIRWFFLTATALLLATIFLLYQGIRNLTTSYDWVNHTWEVQYKVQRILAGLQNAEGGVSGYAISGDTSLLTAKKVFNQHFARWVANLEILVKDNPQQAKNLAQLEHFVLLRMGLLQRTLERDAAHIEEQRRLQHEGTRLMQQIEAIARAMHNLENKLLVQREQTKDRYVRQLAVYLVALSTLLLLAMIFLLNRLIRQINSLSSMQKQLQESYNRLEAQKTALEESNEELESFNFIASHDLKEPLRKIRTFASIIEKSEEAHLSESGKNNLQRLAASAERMQALLDDFQVYARLKLPLESLIDVPMLEMVTHTVKSLEETLKATGAIIETEQLPLVKGSPFQLQQLVENLLSNAIKYRRQHVTPHIHISGSVITAGEVRDYKGNCPFLHCISFADNGMGFSQEYAQKIFDLFFRLHNQTHSSGTGIGLTICKKVAENHGGFIVAESRVNEGTVFRVYLPKHD